MADDVDSAVEAVEDAVIDGLGLRDAVDGALRDAQNSGLPDLVGGPADAYRHLLITGEIVRRYGPVLGPPLATLHEVLNQGVGQTQADTDMDAHNNNLAADGPRHETWQDVVQWARGKIIEAAAHDGDGEDGRAFWYKKQPPAWRPDFTDVSITPIEKGGAEHRYTAADDAGADEAPASPSAGADPLDRPVTGWTEEDVRAVMSSPTYLEASHPRHEQIQRDVRAWFERRFGTGPIPVDATGRAIQAALDPAAKPRACRVPVRAHSRDGGKVEVGAHCRSLPAT